MAHTILLLAVYPDNYLHLITNAKERQTISLGAYQREHWMREYH
jgi:hypothetical protein